MYRLDGPGYRLVMTACADEVARAEPFEAIEIELADLWRRRARKPAGEAERADEA